MLEQSPKTQLPPIPAKRYFTIGEVSELCGVKPHVLRYWEQEFTQLKPVKRRGNRRYYQHHEVLLIRKIRELLYEQGFTISGARNRLDDADPKDQQAKDDIRNTEVSNLLTARASAAEAALISHQSQFNAVAIRKELSDILNLLRPLGS